MTSYAPSLIDATNLSLAWARTYQEVARRPDKEILALNVSFTGLNFGEPEEDPVIRDALDACLASENMQEVETVADTIFPQPLWNLAKGDRAQFFSEYLENLPAYVSMAPRQNNRGLYFGRLVAWNKDPKTGKQISSVNRHLEAVDGNQLEFIIQQCKPQARRSKFQAGIFDPARDHTPAAQLGFPCLQHLYFIPDFRNGTLLLDAFYATQQLFAKAYGNFLGLARLGIFVGHETGLTLDRVNCFVGVEKIDRKPRYGRPQELLKSAIVHSITRVDTESNGRGNLVHG